MSIEDQDREQFDALLREAHELGYHYGRHPDSPEADLSELMGIVALLREEAGKGHPVPCYGRSFDPTDRKCRICQLAKACSELDPKPRVEITGVQPMQGVPCEVCGRGTLEEELLTEDGDPHDYRCTTVGCPNTLSIQCGWTEELVQHLTREVAIEPETPETPEESDTASDTPPSDVGDPAPPVTVQIPKSKLKPKKADKKKTKTKKASKKKAKKADKKADKKKAKTKKAVTIKTTKKAVVKRGNARVMTGFEFKFNGKTYDSLTQIACLITEGNNWSGLKFFKVKMDDLEPGKILERTWKGATFQVEVQ